MTQSVEIKQQQAFVVLNPVAGRTTPADVRYALEQVFGDGWTYSIYETQPDDDITAKVKQALAEGCDLVVAAGGDGTVSMVANGLVGSTVPLGIIPAGSANVLALELGIPGEIPAAAALLIGNHVQRQLDVMQIENQYFLLQIGIGLDSLMIKDTDRAAKRAFGRWAYMQTLVKKLFGFQSQRFTIIADGKRLRPRAAQVLVANAGTLGAKPLTWGPDIHPNDGRLDLCIVTVRTLFDYPRVAAQFITGKRNNSANIQYVQITDQVTIAADRPMPVQADGEIIGNTPISVKVVPHGIRVIVPPDAEPASPIKVFREANRNT